MLLYRDIFEFDIVIMNKIMRKFGTGKSGWELFYEFYIDPDGYPIDKNGLRTKNGVECTVDGLLSVNRICAHGNIKEKIRAFKEKQKMNW